MESNTHGCRFTISLDHDLHMVNKGAYLHCVGSLHNSTDVEFHPACYPCYGINIDQIMTFVQLVECYCNSIELS